MCAPLLFDIGIVITRDRRCSSRGAGLVERHGLGFFDPLGVDQVGMGGDQTG
jgi:hypothetical protein